MGGAVFLLLCERELLPNPLELGLGRLRPVQLQRMRLRHLLARRLLAWVVRDHHLLGDVGAVATLVGGAIGHAVHAPRALS